MTLEEKISFNEEKIKNAWRFRWLPTVRFIIRNRIGIIRDCKKIIEGERIKRDLIQSIRGYLHYEI